MRLKNTTACIHKSSCGALVLILTDYSHQLASSTAVLSCVALANVVCSNAYHRLVCIAISRAAWWLTHLMRTSQFITSHYRRCSNLRCTLADTSESVSDTNGHTCLFIHSEVTCKGIALTNICAGNFFKGCFNRRCNKYHFSGKHGNIKEQPAYDTNKCAR